MKKIVAGLVLAAAFCATAAHAQVPTGRVLFTENLKWRTKLAAQVGGFVDSTSFKETGAANATADTSVAFDAKDIAPQANGLTSLGDSTLWLRVEVHPVTGSSVNAAGDSMLITIEATDGDDNQFGAITNMNEIIGLEIGSTNAYSVPITWGRRPAEQAGRKKLRVIVRGDMAGEYEGSIHYYSMASSKVR